MDNSIKESGSRKEEILEKSRWAKQDEGIEHAEKKGLVISKLIVMFIGLPLMFLSLIVGQTLTSTAIFILIVSHGFGETLAVYRFTKQKAYLVATIFESIALFLFIFLFIMEIGAIQGWWELGWWG